jgi:hypothetical protein
MTDVTRRAVATPPKIRAAGRLAQAESGGPVGTLTDHGAGGEASCRVEVGARAWSGRRNQRR